jgi:hypothetical protein
MKSLLGLGVGFLYVCKLFVSGFLFLSVRLC